jgi:hypothetical protein
MIQAQKKKTELSKYSDLENDHSRMCKVRTKIVPVIIGALGTTKKGLDKNLPGHQQPQGQRRSHH